MNFFTVSGIAAQRVSPAPSFRTAIFIAQSYQYALMISIQTRPMIRQTVGADLKQANEVRIILDVRAHLLADSAFLFLGHLHFPYGRSKRGAVHNKALPASQAPNPRRCAKSLSSPLPLSQSMTSRMREEPIRSLLLLDANPEERRLISAIAGRAGWSVVGAADEEMALALLQGPHGREVLAALLGSWDAEKGPQLIASLRQRSAEPAGDRPVARRQRVGRGRSDARRRFRFPGTPGRARAAARSARRQCRPPPRRRRARAGLREARARRSSSSS